jgi:hypothetical protein
MYDGTSKAANMTVRTTGDAVSRAVNSAQKATTGRAAAAQTTSSTVTIDTSVQLTRQTTAACVRISRSRNAIIASFSLFERRRR